MNATTLDLRGVSDVALKSQAQSLRGMITAIACMDDEKAWAALDAAEQERRLAQCEPLTERLAAVHAELEAREDEPTRQPPRGFAGRMPAAVFMAGTDLPHEQRRLLAMHNPPSSPGITTMSTAAVPFHSAYIPRQAFEQPGIAAARSIKCFMAAGGNLAMIDQVAAQMYPDDGRLYFKATLQQNVSTAAVCWFQKCARRTL